MPRFLRRLRSYVLAPIVVLVSSLAMADDWPMWRYDAQRSAASNNELPKELNLLWKKSLTPRRQAWDDPLNLDLMTYDRVFEPIVMDGRLFVGFNDRDKLVAMDAKTGDELWSVYAEAPVRLPPAGWNGRVFFCSDDGFLYCVNAVDGELLWKFSGAPNSQHAIGNSRITSAWPARGGPVVRDGTVYVASSIWPFMGTFIHALNAETGEVVWTNDSTGAQYIKQPHSAPSFAGVAPQGALVATEELLIVPGGRSVPAAFDRADGKLRYFEINAGGKGTGGSFVAANEEHFFVHTREKGTRAFDIKKGVKTAFMPNEPVLSDELVYTAEVEDKKNVVRAYGADHKVIWEVDVDGSGDLVLAGENLIAAGKDAITVIRLHKKDKKATIAKSIPVDQKIERLLLADKKIFAVTIDGQLMAFGDGETKSSQGGDEGPEPIDVPAASNQAIDDLLAAGDAEGYAFWFGAADSKEAKTLANSSPFIQLAVVDDDAVAIDRMRRQLDAQNIYGRVTIHQSNAG